MASFNAVTFRYRGGGGRTFPIWNKRMLISVKSLPAGNTPVIQEIGMDVQRLAIVARMTGAQLASMYDQVQQSGSLVMAWETVSAYLENIEGVTQVVTGQDVYEATLNMIRL